MASATVPVNDNDESGSPKLIDSKKYFSLYFISSTNPNVSAIFAIFSNSEFEDWDSYCTRLEKTRNYNVKFLPSKIVSSSMYFLRLSREVGRGTRILCSLDGMYTNNGIFSSNSFRLYMLME